MTTFRVPSQLPNPAKFEPWLIGPSNLALAVAPEAVAGVGAGVRGVADALYVRDVPARQQITMRLRRGSDSAAPGRRPRRPAAGGGNGNEQKKQKNTSESSRSSRRRKTSCSPLARRLVRILSSPTAGSMSSAITLDRSGDSRAAAAPSTSASVPQAIKG